jgi:ABC-type lipoprotein export system ATPase subunit
VYYSVDASGPALTTNAYEHNSVDARTAAGRAGTATHLHKTHSKTILSSVHGVVESGQILAVMGPSDAGKSTLLDILADRKNAPGAVLSGSILYNGQTAKDLGPIFSRLVGYVVQDSYLLHTLTVRETLLYTAELRLPASMLQSRRLEIVDDVIEQLGLINVRNSKVGDESNRGVSGGEYRRLSIGIELVTTPSVLILDEPTLVPGARRPSTLVASDTRVPKGKVMPIISWMSSRAMRTRCMASCLRLPPRSITCNCRMISTRVTVTQWP